MTGISLKDLENERKEKKGEVGDSKEAFIYFLKGQRGKEEVNTYQDWDSSGW